MKIAFIDVTVTTSFGGIQTAVWQLSSELSRLGHDVHIFGGAREGFVLPSHETLKVHQFPYVDRKVFPNLGTRFRKLAERLSFAYYARQAFVEEQFDWALLTKPFDFIWPRIVKNRCATKFAFMSGGTDFFASDRYWSKYISAWLACSHFNGWQLHHHYHLFPQIMFNGVDTTKFQQHSNDTLRESLGFTKQDIVFGFAGRLVGWKGLDFAIKALAVLSSYPSAKLLFIGDGPAKPSLMALAQHLNLESRVLFYPMVPHHELPSYLAAFDVGIFPSVGDEAFGISIAETMSCGKPVVASYVGGISEVVGNEASCGLLWTPGDIEDLAKKMEWLINHPQERHRMGQAARARVIEKFQWHHSAQKLLRVLSSR